MMTADDDSYYSYESISAADLTAGPTYTVTTTATVIATSRCIPNDAFY